MVGESIAIEVRACANNRFPVGARARGHVRHLLGVGSGSGKRQGVSAHAGDVGFEVQKVVQIETVRLFATSCV